MTLPASGIISANDINIELGVGGTTTFSLNQASARALAGVPSGTISYSDFYGASAGSVTLPGTTTFNTQAAGAPTTTQTAGFKFKTDGTIDKMNNGVDAYIQDWWSAAPSGGIGSSYQVRATLSGGSAPNGSSSALNTWFTMSSDIHWLASQGSIGSRNCVILVQIRDVATMTIQDSATYDMTALIF